MEPLNVYLAQELAAAYQEIENQKLILAAKERTLTDTQQALDFTLERLANANHALMSQRHQLHRSHRTIHRQRDLLVQHGLARTLPPTFRNVQRRLLFSDSEPDTDEELEFIDLTSD